MNPAPSDDAIAIQKRFQVKRIVPTESECYEEIVQSNAEEYFRKRDQKLAVIQYLKDHGVCTVFQVAKATGLSWSVVSDISINCRTSIERIDAGTNCKIAYRDPDAVVRAESEERARYRQMAQRVLDIQKGKMP